MTDKTSPSLFVRIDGTDAAAMKSIPELQPLLARYIEMRTNADDNAVAIAAARNEYCTDDIEIDDNPAVSLGDDGTWVAAWVFVPPPEDGGNEAIASEAGLQVRHDRFGWYVCTDDEGEHEDVGNQSVGFDGREHWQTEEKAWAAAAKQAEGGE